MADALILLSIARWAGQNAKHRVVFYTLNRHDFSAEDEVARPHGDLEQYFAPWSNLEYRSNLGDLHFVLKELDPADFYPQNLFGCSVCDEDSPIEHLVCLGCGTVNYDAIGEESYFIKPFGGGYLINRADHEDLSLIS